MLGNDRAYQTQYDVIEDVDDQYGSIEELVVANLRHDMKLHPERYPDEYGAYLDHLQREDNDT